MLFTVPELDDLEIGVLSSIDRMRSDLAFEIREPRRWTGLLARSVYARAIRGSNSIEGINVSQEDAVAVVAGEDRINASLDNWKAVTGYRTAMDFVLQRARDGHFDFSEDLLLSLHFMMIGHDLEKNPGRWRPGDIYVRKDDTGEIVYTGPDRDGMNDLITEFLDQTNRSSNSPLLIHAAMTHLNFVMIHPFSDGNGRMSRCLQTAVLARDGIVAPQFSSIEEYIGREQNTQKYYRVLARVGGGKWQPQKDTRPWIRFCLTAHFRQAATQLRRVDQIRALFDELEKVIHRHKLQERMILALADAALGYRVYNATYRSAAEVSMPQASRDLKALSDLGLLEPHGQRRGRFYKSAKEIIEIRNRVIIKKPIRDPFDRKARKEVQRSLPGI